MCYMEIYCFVSIFWHSNYGLLQFWIHITTYLFTLYIWIAYFIQNKVEGQVDALERKIHYWDTKIQREERLKVASLESDKPAHQAQIDAWT